jgi:hypothetical protein
MKAIGCVWFVPKIHLPKFWLAIILIELFLAHKLSNIDQKKRLELVGALESQKVVIFK